jgi:hypothetical protein
MSNTKPATQRKTRKLVTLNPTKKTSFAIGVSADNYHFVTKLAEANNSNRQAMLDKIVDHYAASVLRNVA